MPVGQHPREIDVSTDGRRAVVANSGDDSISVVDLVERKELYQVKVGRIPYGVSLVKGESVALVTNWGENTVSVVDLKRRAEGARRLKVGSLPYTLFVSGDHAFVTNFGAHEVTPIDLKNYQVEAAVNVGRSPWGAGVSADGQTAVVANFYSGDLSFLRVRDGKASETARLDLKSQEPKVESRSPKNAAVTEDGKMAVVSDLANNELLLVDLNSKKLLRTIPVGKAPYGIAFVSHARTHSARN